MVRLYGSAVHPKQWVAYVPGSGWVTFPAKLNGWAERRPARGLDPMHLREVRIECASETGILEDEPALAGVA